MPGQPFFWYELMTSDVDAAAKFYAAVVGWTPRPFDMAGGSPYTVLNVGERGVGGVMGIPQPGMPPAWVGYVHTADIEAACRKLEKAGGKVSCPWWLFTTSSNGGSAAARSFFS